MQVGRGRDEGELVTCRLSRDSGRDLAMVAGFRGVRHLKKLPCGTSTRCRCIDGRSLLAGLQGLGESE